MVVGSSLERSDTLDLMFRGVESLGEVVPPVVGAGTGAA